MKIKQIFAAIAVMTALSVGPALAQPSSGTASTGSAISATKTKSMKKFEAYKERTLKRLEKRATEIQKKQACVTVATTPKALHACFPKWHKYHGKRRDRK